MRAGFEVPIFWGVRGGCESVSTRSAGSGGARCWRGCGRFLPPVEVEAPGGLLGGGSGRYSCIDLPARGPGGRVVLGLVEVGDPSPRSVLGGVAAGAGPGGRCPAAAVFTLWGGIRGRIAWSKRIMLGC